MGVDFLYRNPIANDLPNLYKLITTIPYSKILSFVLSQKNQETRYRKIAIWVLKKTNCARFSVNFCVESMEKFCYIYTNREL